MDICLCRIDAEPNQTKVIFSGAKRPLYHYDNQSCEIKRFKGTSKSIAGRKSIKDNKCEILYHKAIRTTDNNSHGYPSGKNSDWHNGIAIFVLKKNNYFS